MGVNMGWMTRFEPATSGSTDRRSNQLSYIHHKSIPYYTNFLPSLQKAPVPHGKHSGPTRGVYHGAFRLSFAVCDRGLALGHMLGQLVRCLKGRFGRARCILETQLLNMGLLFGRFHIVRRQENV